MSLLCRRKAKGCRLAVLEALAAGMPAVISPGCNMPEVETSGAGFVVDASVDAVAAKLRDLLVDGGLRERMGTAARELVAERFTWDHIASQLESVLSAKCGIPIGKIWNSSVDFFAIIC